MPLTDEHRAAQAARNTEYGALTARIFVKPMLEKVLAPSPLAAMFPPPQRAPLTRWERVKRRLQVYRERLVLAWRVLRGDDIHEDC